MRKLDRKPAALALLFLLGLGAGATPAAAQANRIDELRYPPLREIPIPRPERVVLDNGMVVMLLEDSELPLIEVTAVVRAGSRLDPADEVGLGDLAGEVMRSGGTARLPGDALDDYLEDRAASIEVSVGNAMTSVNLSALKADFPDLLRVFADVLRRPAFDARKLDVAKNQAIASVARQNDSPQAIVFRELTELVYGAESPYAWTETYASLGNIDRDDLLAWHRRHFHPDRVVLGLTGDFKKEEVLRQVREVFGDWPRGPKAADAGVPFRTQPAAGVYRVAKEDVAQSFIALGHLGVRKDDPDYYALDVLNQVLSGSLASRLGAIRSRKGLAYSVFGQVGSAWDYPGMALLFVSTKRETTGAAIDALLEEIDKLRTEPPTDQEVEAARQALLNSYVFSAESRRQVLAQQVMFEAYGYPLDWLTRYRDGVEKVSTGQVRQAALRHLRRQDLAILVVGPSQGLDKPLDSYGKVTPVDITIAPPKGQPAGR